MRSSVDFLSTDGAGEDAHGAEEIPPSHARRRGAASSGAKLRRPKGPNAVLPILALRPTGDGTALARVLARVLVRRALRHERAFETVEDCAISTR